MPNDHEQDGYPSPGRGWYVVAVLTVAYVFSFIDRQVLSLLVEPTRRGLDVSDSQMGLLGGLTFAVFYTLFGIPLGRLAGLAAIAAVVSCPVVLTRWLLARRSVAFARLHLPETRPAWALWVGCLVPVVNLAWAPVFVMELAKREDRLDRLRKPIVVWWAVWAASTAVAIFATATSSAAFAFE